MGRPVLRTSSVLLSLAPPPCGGGASYSALKCVMDGLITG